MSAKPTPNADYGAEQIEDAIFNALAAGDVAAADDLLRVLATVNAARAVMMCVAVAVATASPNDGTVTP